jgi:nicotinamidase-related amidase
MNQFVRFRTVATLSGAASVLIIPTTFLPHDDSEGDLTGQRSASAQLRTLKDWRMKAASKPQGERIMDGLEIEPKRTALLNVDMQRCFVEGTPIASPESLTLLPQINELLRASRSAGVTVIHTRGWMRPDGSNVGVMAELVPPFIVALYTEGNASAELHEGLEVEQGDIILNKPRYGAFHGTDLEMILRSRGIDTVIVSGIATNICCETTAREAAQRDFRVIFLSDGTATSAMGGVPASELQRATCASLGMVFAKIATLEDVHQALR